MSPRRPLAVLLVLAAGCAGLPAGGPPPATVTSFRGNPSLCGHSGSPVCEARVNHVEGRPVFSAAESLEVEPGRRTLGLFCKIGLSIMIGDAQSFQREVTAVLAPGGRYRVEAAMEPKPCTMTLVDQATGKPVGTVR
jgi:hypothetical protein